jgi:hypothetical protein
MKHPFLTVEKGFVPVVQLKLGMHVVEAGNRAGVVTAWKSVSGVQTMYNLEVTQNHTYTVGINQFVVHNSDGADCNLSPNDWRNSSLNNAPNQTTSGTKNIDGVHINDQGDAEPYTGHYDEYGRLVRRTDYTNGNAAEGIPGIHSHAFIYNQDFPNGIGLPPDLNHAPGEYSPEIESLFYLF